MTYDPSATPEATAARNEQLDAVASQRRRAEVFARCAEDCDAAARLFRSAGETPNIYDADEALHDLAIVRARVEGLAKVERVEASELMARRRQARAAVMGEERIAAAGPDTEDARAVAREVRAELTASERIRDLREQAAAARAASPPQPWNARTLERWADELAGEEPAEGFGRTLPHFPKWTLGMAARLAELAARESELAGDEWHEYANLKRRRPFGS